MIHVGRFTDPLTAMKTISIIVIHFLMVPFSPLMAADPVPPLRVLVWDEQQPEQRATYDGKFLGETIAAHLSAQPGLTVTNASLSSPSQGLDEETLDNTDVVIWWSHQKNDVVDDAHVDRLVSRVLRGRLGLVVLHSAHWSKPFVRLMQQRAIDDARALIPAAERAEAVFAYENEAPYGKVPGADAPLTPALRKENGVWRLYGEKWFASHTDAHVALALARPEGAPPGIKGVAMFALPRYLPDGSRNKYRIVRIKEKLGTRSLASCEVMLEGAEAYLVGREDRGIKQMMEEVNMSRLSHGVRAAGQMRRAYNESMQVARNRSAWGKQLIEHPLMRRQLIKILVPAEQGVSVFMLAASQLDQANAGSESAKQVVRMLTPLIKIRACRDAVIAARAALESRAGNGVIEEWVNPKLVRDAHIALVWEGTSNINAIDVIRRAVGKSRAHEPLKAVVLDRLGSLTRLPDAYRLRLQKALDRAFDFANDTAASSANEHLARQAASGMYHAVSAVMLAWEACQPCGDVRKLLTSRFVLEHRLEPIDPLSPPDGAWEDAAYTMLFDETCKVTLAETVALVSNSSRRVR